MVEVFSVVGVAVAVEAGVAVAAFELGVDVGVAQDVGRLVGAAGEVGVLELPQAGDFEVVGAQVEEGRFAAKGGYGKGGAFQRGGFENWVGVAVGKDFEHGGAVGGELRRAEGGVDDVVGTVGQGTPGAKVADGGDGAGAGHADSPSGGHLEVFAGAWVGEEERGETAAEQSGCEGGVVFKGAVDGGATVKLTHGTA